MKDEKEDNALWKHCVTEHGGTKVKFGMKVLRSHRSPLTRQIQESVEIEYSKADIIMNSKGEWNGSRIPRIVIEVGDEIQEEEQEEQARYRRKGDSRQNKKDENKGGWIMENLKKRKENEKVEGEQRRKRMRWTRSKDEIIYDGTKKQEVSTECASTKPPEEADKITRNPECDQAEINLEETKCGPNGLSLHEINTETGMRMRT